jgi:hypothetical protein
MNCTGGCYECNCQDITVANTETIEITFEKDKTVEYIFNESKYLEELKDYIDSTYLAHYSQNRFQTTEIIIERGRGTGFCMGNVDKYSNRYGKKGSREDHRKDLMKILHFAILQLYIHDNDKG